MLKFGLDWDDVIAPFNDVAIALANEEQGLDLKLEDIDSWENTGRASVIKKYYDDPRIYERQKVSDEAKDFVNTLRKKGEVYFITAVAPKYMSVRAQQIFDAFPDFPEKNIIMGYQKSLVQFDVTLDDGPHNILKSCAKYPVLMRRPWNRMLSGLLSVTNYDEFLQLVDQIKESMIEDKKPIHVPSVIALVGPSGSRKKSLSILMENWGLGKFIYSYTTGPENGLHKHISEEQFKDWNSEFVTTTMYAGNLYGVKVKDVKETLENNEFPIIPLDIGGAISMKRMFPTTIIFCRASREKMIRSILEKEISNEEKTYRLLSIEKELDNAKLCDFVVRTDTTLEAYMEVMKIYGKTEK